MRWLVICTIVLAATAASPAAAQDGVFDMGQLTGSLSLDHITQSERARARRQHAAPASRRRQARICADLPSYRARYGADRRVARLALLCRRAGFRPR